MKSTVPPGELSVRAVDVVQGSAAVADTAGHRILVDTGPRFGNRDVVRSNILPMLSSTGPHELKLLLLSHTDMGHASELNFFRRYFERLTEIGPHNCEHGMSSRKDGAGFTTLLALGLTADNDLSCMLLIETIE